MSRFCFLLLAVFLADAACAACVVTAPSLSFGPYDGLSGAVSPQTADALIEALGKLPPALATRVAPVAAHAAMLSGRNEALHAALETMPAEVRLELDRALMTHGRLLEFPRIQQLARGDMDWIARSNACRTSNGSDSSTSVPDCSRE